MQLPGVAQAKKGLAADLLISLGAGREGRQRGIFAEMIARLFRSTLSSQSSRLVIDP